MGKLFTVRVHNEFQSVTVVPEQQQMAGVCTVNHRRWEKTLRAEQKTCCYNVN